MDIARKPHMHVRTSVELYIPWNNTWVFLPELPTFKDGDVVKNMTNTQIYTHRSEIRFL